MPRYSSRKTTRRIIGRGSVINWIRNKAIPWLKKAHSWVKDKKIISTVAGMIPHPYAQTIAKGASVLGYGRRRIGYGRGCGCYGRGCGCR